MYFFGRRTTDSNDGDIAIRLVNEPQPEFRRGYVVKISGGFRIEIELHTAYGRRMDSAQLYQANGKYIIFDVNAVADKIIDRDLYPRVQEIVDRVLVIDEAFVASKPSQFTDEKGVSWQRIK